MFQFRRFPTYAYLIQRRLTEYCSAGFPHSVIPGSMPMCGSPRLIAACHDLLRLLMPRHSPCALSSLTSSAWTSHPSLPPPGESSLAPSRLLFLADPLTLGSARRKVQTKNNWFSSNHAGINRSFLAWLIVLPDILKSHNLLCPLLLALNTSFCIVQFSRCRPSGLFQGQIEILTLVSTSICPRPARLKSGGPKWTRTTDLTIISRAL